MSDRLKLDRYDLAILQTLQQEGRITKVALAESVNLSSSPCWERLRRLEDEGYITGYQASVDLRKLAPITEVIVEVTLAKHKAESFTSFETAIQSESEIVECSAVGGGVDYVMKLVVPDVDAYQRNVPPHVQAARKLARPTRRIRYVITASGPEPVLDAIPTPDYSHYRDRQLAPAADGILRFLGTSFDALTDRQLAMF